MSYNSTLSKSSTRSAQDKNMDYIRRMSEKSRLQKLKQAEEEKAKSSTK